eukprot:Sspe_Gene.27160::Locus_11578_Transcript_1_1_Confidence_1.000_Length_1748::g.27160::m.27160/K00814/GPT, ALT; alanine transaminase
MGKLRLTLEGVNQALVRAEYAVRGEIVTLSHKIEKELKENPSKYPFKEVIACNIGNPQALLQKPVTYNRQVMCLVDNPWLINTGAAKEFKPDIVKRAQDILDGIGHANMTGAYTHSQGYDFVRQHVAEFISKRDGVECDPANIFLTDGASPGVKMMIEMLITNKDDAIMIPIPQYPLYSAALTIFEGEAANYYLDEEANWALTRDALEKGYKEAQEAGKNVRALVVINPGNPTGQCLTEEQILGVCKFAKERDLVLMADEVYQENIYGDAENGGPTEFTSFRKVVSKYKEVGGIPLASFHSVSKGVLGECGRRGGYMEIFNFPTEIHQLLYKTASVSLCPNVNGQIMVDLMVKTPQPGEESYQAWYDEYEGLKASLHRRAKLLYQGLNKIPGIKCNPVMGAMYAFPAISLPPKAIKEAEKIGKKPDTMWCIELLKATGIVVVPGSGFGQRENTYHFRTTILPPEDKLDEVLDRMHNFQKDFLAKYS